MSMTGTEQVAVLGVGLDDAFELGRRLAARDETIEYRTARDGTTPGPPPVAQSASRFDCVALGAGADWQSLLSRVRAASDVPVVVAVVAPGRVSDALSAGATDVVRAEAVDDHPEVLARRVLCAVERDRARQDADRRERRLHALLEHSTDRLSVLDADGRYTFVSPAVERTTGHSPAALEGARGLEYVHPSDRERVRDCFERALEGDGPSGPVEYRFRDAGGQWRWVESRFTDRRDDPAVDGVVVNSRAITDRKERESDLREEQALTEAIFSGLPDVLYAFDESGEFLRWNDEFRAVTGYSDAEIASMHPTEFVVESDRETVVEAIADVVEQGKAVTVEARFETKSGEVIPYEFTGARMTGGTGELTGVVGIGRDISDRVERQRRFEAVFNNTYQFTGLMRPDGTLIEANDTALEFGAVDREDVLGRKVWDTYWFRDNPDAREAARAAVERAREGDLYREEIEVRGAEGTEYIDFSVRPIVDDQGSVTLLIPEGRTITELKRREQHLGLLHRFLRHNLRNKMTVVGNAAGALSEDPDLPSELDRYVTAIENAAAELVELSETAYRLSRIAIGVETDREPIDLDRTLTRMAADVRDRYPGASLSVTSDSGIRVSADWRLRTVVEQLVENGIEHSDWDRPTVEVDVERDGSTATVRIADDGPGIPEDELVGVVADDEPTQLTHGSGFGLRLVRLIVDDYGGDLSYDVPADGGSVVSLTLPTAGE